MMNYDEKNPIKQTEQANSTKGIEPQFYRATITWYFPFDMHMYLKYKKVGFKKYILYSSYAHKPCF